MFRHNKILGRIFIFLGFLSFTIALAVDITGSVASELLINGGFESGAGGAPDGWSRFEGSISQSTSIKRSGNASGAFTSNSPNQKSVYQKLAITPGSRYSFSAYIYKNTTSIAAVYLRLTWFATTDGTGTELGFVDSTETLTTNQNIFRILSINSVVAPANSRSAMVSIVVVPSSPNTGIIYIDDATFLQAGAGSLTPTLTSTATTTVTASPSPIYSPTLTGTSLSGYQGTPSPTSTQTPTSTPARTSSSTPTPTVIAPGEILINEVQLHPEQDPETDFEWLELYNTTSRNLILLNWRIMDNHFIETLPAISLQAGEYVIIAGNTDRFREAFPDLTGKVLGIPDGTLGDGLANSADLLVLQDATGRTIDAVNWGRPSTSWTNFVYCPWNDGVNSVSLGKTMGRYPDHIDLDSRDDWQENMSASPGQPNRLPSPTVVSPTSTRISANATATSTPSPSATPVNTAIPGSITINEIFPAPHKIDLNEDGEIDSDDEFIELYNSHINGQHLGGIRLSDSSGREFVVPDDITIAPLGYRAFFGSDSGIRLNNDGDIVTIADASGQLIDQHKYQNAEYDESFIRYPDGSGLWRSSSSPSPGEPNIATAALPGRTPTPRRTITPSPTPTVEINATIAQAKQLPGNTRLTLYSQVTSLPNILGAKRIYVQDHTSGIAVNLQTGEYPDLQEGDWIRIRGRRHESRGEKQIQVTRPQDITLVSSGDPPEGQQISLSEIGEETEGELVVVEGQLTRKESQSLYLWRENGTGRAFVRPQTGINSDSLSTGNYLRITGIVSQYDTQPPYDEGFRLLPRSPSDILIISELKEPVTLLRNTTSLPGVLPRAGGLSPGLIYLTGLVLIIIGAYLVKPSVREAQSGRT